MSRSHPRVSIITATYNGSKYISETIESVLGQDFTDFEYIIVNDASRDSVEEIIKSHQAQDPRIIYIQNDVNSERAISRNKGLAIAKGEFIAFLDDDDIRCMPNKLSLQIKYLEEHSDIAVVGSNIYIIDGQGNIIRKQSFSILSEEIKNRLLGRNQIAFSTVVARADAIQEAGGFNEDPSIIECEDYDLWLSVGKKYGICNIPEYTVQYRVFERNYTWDKNIKKAFIPLKLYTKYFHFYNHKIRALGIQLLLLLIPFFFLLPTRFTSTCIGRFHKQKHQVP